MHQGRKMIFCDNSPSSFLIFSFYGYSRTIKLIVTFYYAPESYEFKLFLIPLVISKNGKKKYTFSFKKTFFLKVILLNLCLSFGHKVPSLNALHLCFLCGLNTLQRFCFFRTPRRSFSCKESLGLLGFPTFLVICLSTRIP